jgi:hypothetical protein
VVLRIHPLRHPAFAPNAPEDEDEGDETTASEKEKSKDPRKKKAPALPLLDPEERRFIAGGGRLLLAAAEDYGPLRVAGTARRGALLKVFPVWPGVRSVVTKAETRALSGLPVADAVTLFARGTAPILSRLALGRGEVLLFALPEVFENAALAEADHLRLLVAIVGEGRPVYFDEWAHGLDRQESLVGLLLAWGFGPALLVALLAFALWLWRGRARAGPEERDPVRSRSEAVDLVDSLAQLYDRALRRCEAVRLYRDHFAKAVSLQTGLRGRALDQRVEALAGREAARLRGGPEIPPSEFARLLRAIGDGYRRLHEHVHPHRRL